MTEVKNRDEVLKAEYRELGNKLKSRTAKVVISGLKDHRVIEVYRMETGPSAQLVHAAQFLPLS